MRACGVMLVPASTAPAFDTGEGGLHSFAAGAFGEAGEGHGDRVPAAATWQGGPEARWWVRKEVKGNQGTARRTARITEQGAQVLRATKTKEGTPFLKALARTAAGVDLAGKMVRTVEAL